MLVRVLFYLLLFPHVPSDLVPYLNPLLSFPLYPSWLLVVQILLKHFSYCVFLTSACLTIILAPALDPLPVVDHVPCLIQACTTLLKSGFMGSQLEPQLKVQVPQKGICENRN